MSRQLLPTQTRPQAVPATSAASAPAASTPARTPRLTPTRVAWLLLLITPLLAALLLVVQRSPMDAQALTTFEAAGALYTAGDPALAQQAYAQLVGQGGGGVALWHNWGAAALRAGDLKTAVSALETAQQHAPRDVELATSLRVARAMQAQSASAEGESPAAIAPPNGLAALLAPIRAQWLAPDELALAALGLWVLLCALLLVALTPARRPRRLLRFAALAAALPVALALAVALAALFSGAPISPPL